MTIDRIILKDDISLFIKNKKAFTKYNKSLYDNLAAILFYITSVDKHLKFLKEYKTNDIKVDFDSYFNNILILVNDIFINIYKLKSFIINDFEYTC